MHIRPLALSIRVAPLLILATVVGVVWFCSHPAVVLSQSRTEKEGCGCHSAETKAWQDSPHAMAAQISGDLPSPTCEGCHGPYIRGHPDDGLMRLTVDSAVCHDCHSDTFEQWQGSVHAEKGVQCIGCHLPHAQELRVSEEKLCLSCHRQSVSDGFHISHRYADVSCTNCHLALPSGIHSPASNADDSPLAPTTPLHDFVSVSGTECVECHRQYIGNDSSRADAGDVAVVKLMTVANRVPELTDSLQAARQQNSALVAMSFVSLGLGIGVGGVMGIILVLVVGYVTQRKPDK